MVDREPVDFDAAWAELEDAAGPPPSIRVRGEVIDLPRAMPAKVVLFTVRHRDRLEGNAPDPEAVAELAGLLFDPERVERWVAEGMAMAGLYAAYLAARREIHRPNPAEPEGEARPPETGDSSTTSSPDGPPSKPTGNGSTTET